MSQGKPREHRLIVASVRLPVSLSQGDGVWNVADSPGGLATALRDLAASRPFTWIGWPGTAVPEEAQYEVRSRLEETGRNVPVFIDPERFAGFYEQFSNRLLWPLFHNLPERSTFDRDAWHDYQAVNGIFADAIAKIAQPGDLVWVHDYQLALVPRLLRRRGLDIGIGFFLHIPFPSSQIYRTIPTRSTILEGMLGANLIGFHTYEYVGNFRNACLRVLGLDSDPDSIALPAHTARLSVLPIGIDLDQFQALGQSDEAKAEIAAIKKRYAGKRLVIGVDRLDYTKGIPQKLLAYAEFLRAHPEWHGKVVLLQVASPSRSGVLEYQQLKSEVDELVGAINGEFGAVDWTPVVYISQHLSRQELFALYAAADVAFITPLRDGMNLVALEYVAARGDDPGTLILSEFAGAASCLSGARLVNPHDTLGMARVLSDALERGVIRQSFAHMVAFTRGNSAQSWAGRFLDRLESSYAAVRGGVPRLDAARIDASAGEGSGPPLFLLDYDGTLEPHALLPEHATPSPRVRRLLAELSKVARVYVVSGRQAEFLEQWLGDLPIGLACEHGLSIRPLGGEWSERPDIDRTVLVENVLPLLGDFVERTPGSKIEEKEASVAWHYRAADPKLGAWRAKELHAALEELLRGQPFTILVGSRVLEVRHYLMSKARVVTILLEQHRDASLVFAAGNDRTDEEMFEALARAERPGIVTCRVGTRNTAADTHVESPDELLARLDYIARSWRALERSPDRVTG